MKDETAVLEKDKAETTETVCANAKPVRLEQMPENPGVKETNEYPGDFCGCG